MTIYFPDLSNYTPVIIEQNTVAVVCRVTLSDSLFDGFYNNCKQQCRNKGIPFGAYHWLNHGNIESQALWCFSHNGTTPLMLDCEDLPGNTGYNGTITLDDIQEFVEMYRGLGGTCNVVYLPRWYWSGHMGSPTLSALFSGLGLSLVSSNYTTYSDDGPGWQQYGGVTPTFWQYTARFPYGGGLVDFNAFKGDISEWQAIWSGDSPTTPSPSTSWTEQLIMDLPTVLRGSTGISVKRAQALLNVYGYNLLEDGIFGAHTDAATRDFQGKHALLVDGIVGQHTYTALLTS